MANLPTKMLACAVCREPLPEGTKFCVACGHDDVAGIEMRKGTALLEADRRLTLAGCLRAILRRTRLEEFLAWIGKNR